MKKIMQRDVGEGTGDCFSACLGSLLEIDDVPNFVGQHKGYWFTAANDWLAERGLALVMAKGGDPYHQDLWLPDDVPFIASVDGPRGLRHAIVAARSNGKIVVIHDPNPGEQCTGEEVCHFIYFVVRIYPAGIEVLQSASQ